MSNAIATGCYQCPKCGYMKEYLNLNADDGTVSARDEPGGSCPNCRTPLWRMTHEQVEALERKTDDFPKPQRKDGATPCGECHLSPGETCDICGAVSPTQPATHGDASQDGETGR